MNLESIIKAVDEIVKDIPVTIQINKLTSSYLSVVFSRQKDCIIEYTDLCEKVLETFKSFEMDEIKSIKFFGKESGESDYEWQYDFNVNANSHNVLASSSNNYLSKLINSIKTAKDKKTNKSLVIGSVVFILISTGVGGFTYFKNVQYQQAKQAAKQAISQDFLKCENANLSTENITGNESESSEIQKLRNQPIIISKKANDAKIKNTQDRIKVLEDYKSLLLTYDSQKSQVEAMTATGKIEKSMEIALLSEIEQKKIRSEYDKDEKLYNLKKELINIESSEQAEIISVDRQIAERQLVEIAEKKKADEEKKQKMEDDKKSCQVVEDYKRKYEK